ncbi:MAG: hypothetical protein OXI01_03045 [Albidovulum sp.]|nr:hypothetical protein [Albidovulum sp.]
MLVTTPIADLEIEVDRIFVEDGALVMTNAASDAMATRAVMGPNDVRKIFGALIRPRVVWFALTCLFRSSSASRRESGIEDFHPTPNPW